MAQGRWKGNREILLDVKASRTGLLDTTGVGGTETTLHTYTLPGGLVRIGDALEIFSAWTADIGSATAKTCKVYCDGTSNVIHQASIASVRYWRLHDFLSIRALSGAGAIVGGTGSNNYTGSFTTTSFTIISMNVNLAADVTFNFRAIWGAEDNLGNSIFLEGAYIKLLRG